jgi:hypothetical protein
MLPIATRILRPTWHERGSCILMLVSVRLYRILKLDVFRRGPYAGMPSRPDNTGAQGVALSITTLKSRPTWHELGIAYQSLPP